MNAEVNMRSEQYFHFDVVRKYLNRRQSVKNIPENK